MAARRPALKMSEPSRPAHTFILLQWLQAEATKKLIGAATSGDLKQVVLLLSLGADIEIKDEVSDIKGCQRWRTAQGNPILDYLPLPPQIPPPPFFLACIRKD